MQTLSFTQKGVRTEDNRDVIITIENNGVYLCAVLDGSSSRFGSGDYARALSENIKKHFTNLSSEELLPVNIKKSINEVVARAHSCLRIIYPSASLSLVILITLIDKVALIFSLGDCAVGRVCSGGLIDWLTVPNRIGRLPISKLNGKPNGENGVIRTLKARRFEQLDWFVRPFHSSTVYVLASDGYWERNISINKQAKSIDDIELESFDDDLSVCVLKKD